MPFGVEIGATTSGRSTGIGYGASDGIRQQFTQKGRDVETGLDFFGARYFALTAGRFTSTDPLLSSATIYDPQTWNRYAYVLNNPVRYVDPLGLYEWDASLGGSATDEELKQRKGGQKIIDRRNEFRNGLAKAAEHAMSKSLNARERAEIQRAVNSYGTEGVANGVTIATGKLHDDASGETSWTLAANGKPNAFTSKLDPTQTHYGVTANVTVTFDGSIDEEGVAHEGSHIADRQELGAAVEVALNGGDPNMTIGGLPQNITKYASELRAYQISSSIVQVNNTPGQFWNRGWSEVDRRIAIDKHLLTNKLYRLSPPGTKPGPGPQLYTEKK